MSEATKQRQNLWTEQEGEVLLRSIKCGQCGSVQFPPQYYGCEECGASDAALEETLVPARGTLHTFTTVYLHEKLETPYQVGEVATAARQLVRGRLDHPDPKPGDDVVGTLREVDGEPQFVFVPKTDKE